MRISGLLVTLLVGLTVAGSEDEVEETSSTVTSVVPVADSELEGQRHNPDSLDYRDNVKLVLEDFELSILKSESLQLNSSADNATAAVAAASQRPKLNCLPSYHVAEGETAVVSLLNATELQARLAEESSPSVANRTFPANCSLTFFYASWCEFRQAWDS